MNGTRSGQNDGSPHSRPPFRRSPALVVWANGLYFFLPQSHDDAAFVCAVGSLCSNLLFVSFLRSRTCGRRVLCLCAGCGRGRRTVRLPEQRERREDWEKNKTRRKKYEKRTIATTSRMTHAAHQTSDRRFRTAQEKSKQTKAKLEAQIFRPSLSLSLSAEQKAAAAAKGDSVPMNGR